MCRNIELTFILGMDGAIVALDMLLSLEDHIAFGTLVWSVHVILGGARGGDALASCSLVSRAAAPL